MPAIHLAMMLILAAIGMCKVSFTRAGLSAPRGSAVTASPSLKVNVTVLVGVILVMVYLSPPSSATWNVGLAFTRVVYLSPVSPTER